MERVLLGSDLTVEGNIVRNPEKCLLYSGTVLVKEHKFNTLVTLVKKQLHRDTHSQATNNTVGFFVRYPTAMFCFVLFLDMTAWMFRTP